MKRNDNVYYINDGELVDESGAEKNEIICDSYEDFLECYVNDSGRGDSQIKLLEQKNQHGTVTEIWVAEVKNGGGIRCVISKHNADDTDYAHQCYLDCLQRAIDYDTNGKYPSYYTSRADAEYWRSEMGVK